MIDDNIVSGICVKFPKGTDAQAFYFLFDGAMKQLQKYCKENYNLDPHWKRVAISFEEDAESDLLKLIVRYKHHPSDEITGHERGI